MARKTQRGNGARIHETLMSSLDTYQYVSSAASSEVLETIRETGHNMASNARAKDTADKDSTRNPYLPKLLTGMDRLKNEAEQLYPSKGERLKRLMATMYDWAPIPGNDTINQFCDEYGIDREQLHAYSEQFPDFATCFKRFRRTLADKRFRATMRFELNAKVSLLDLHTMDEQWIPIEKHHAALSSNTSQEAQKGPLVLYEVSTGIKSKEEKAAELGQRDALKKQTQQTNRD